MNLLNNAWYKNARWVRCLRPLSAIFGLVRSLRRNYYRNPDKAYNAKYPVIVVGNITAGGTGKTPLVIFIAQQLRLRGYSPGIVSRGYGSRAASYPFAVTPQSSFREAGEEPLMIARHTHCPVIIDPDRGAAVKMLETRYDCDIIISDDGLQHYRLNRNIEIAVVDGQRGFGNGLLLPAGPLREKPERLGDVDFIVCNGPAQLELPGHSYEMNLDATHLVHLIDNKSLAISDDALQRIKNKKVHAVAGIGNPERFFNSLCASGFDIITHIFRDHHFFSKQDITFADQLDVVMTEKDATKCRDIASDKHWFLKVAARLTDEFMDKLIEKLAAL
jgi:tetraacyldisaccharide 4'-kinase